LTHTKKVTELSDFSTAHPSLAQALAARGYATPTGVQATVLAAPARDLLVSSQTGSGKTVAFGLVIGQVLLGEATRLSAPSARPRALVIAPTRELAAQVQRELAWLLAPGHARVTAFTGGTDIRRDARALHHGVDVAVGTPGRLCDLIERRALDLGGVEVVVLDEADEMLDMGFREALELLLGATPRERRTLLFSATLPPPIRALAQKFQQAPLHLDPRAGGAPAPHADIRHVAHLCADGQRLAALTNILLYEDERAVVFCRTRDAVADLHKQLAKRGFSTEAISGERAQEERTRALEALRDGRVRVLVATDVAARGLDLPELGLVIHVDLPENADSLTHRSGRTGRAGKKGVSVLLVERGAQRRAERLLREARLRVEWSPPPSFEAVAARIRERLRGEISALAAAPVSDDARALAGELLADGDAERLVAALLDKRIADSPRGEKLSAVAAGPASRPPMPSGDMVVFEINIGDKDNADPKWILPMVCRRGEVTRREIGAIRITPDRTFVEIAAGASAEFARNVAERDPRAPHVRIHRSTGPMPARKPTKHPARRGPPPGRPHRK
jgi:ATP-dependent RNA helicase DeaD